MKRKNANQASEMCQSTDFDFITLDMNMPGQDGLEVAPELKQGNEAVNIALLTGNVEDEVRVKAEELGPLFPNRLPKTRFWIT